MATVRTAPGPAGTFLGGNLADVRRDMLGFYLRIARQYGDVVSFRLGPHRFHLINHPDLIEEVLVQRAREFRKNYAFRMNRLLLGNGLLTSEGDFWLRQRRLAQPAFHRDRLRGYAAMMVEHTQRMLESWQPGGVRDLRDDMTRLTLGIIVHALFGADVGGDAAEVGAALTEAQDSFIARFWSLLPLPEWVPTPGNLRLRSAVRRLDAIVTKFIERRRSTQEERDDLLSRFLEARDEDGGRMSDQQLRDEMRTLMLAGHDTTALTLTWSFYALAAHPEYDARLHEELSRVLNGRAPTMDDLSQLTFTEQVVKEALRLYPPAYAYGREPIADLELAGWTIGRGQTALLSPWVTQRDPRFWDDADRFNPDRWTTEKVRELPKFAYFPFGGGPRVCIGKDFATIEAVLLLACVAQRYRLERTEATAVGFAPSLTLRPDGPINMRLVPRTSLRIG